MSHLTKEEIQLFVSFQTLSSENLKLAAKVNTHILECESCLEAVREQLEKYDKAVRGYEGLCASAQSIEKEECENTATL